MRYKNSVGVLDGFFDRFHLKKRKFDPEALDIDDIDLPIVIKNLDSDRVLREMRMDIKTYKLLGYRFKKENEINDKKEYHSMQMGIYIRALKEGYDLRINKNEDYFPEFILKHHFVTIQSMVEEILKKYDKEVNKNLSEQQLLNEVMWTPLDAGYILYYLSFYWKEGL